MPAGAVKRSYHHENLRAKLIETGLKLIADKGVGALTLREIGARAGVSRSAPYRHFHDKADLLAAITEAGFERFADALERARAGAGDDFAARLEALGLAYVRFAAEHREHFTVMFGPVEAPRPTPAGERAFGILVGTIIDGQMRGEVREGDAVQLARLVWSMVHGLSQLRLARDLSENGAGTALVRMSTQILTDGLLPQTVL